MRNKTRGRDRGDRFRIFQELNSSFGVARTWESVARLYCTSLNRSKIYNGNRELGLNPFQKILRIRRDVLGKVVLRI